jgi:hypothetical protein
LTGWRVTAPVGEEAIAPATHAAHLPAAAVGTPEKAAQSHLNPSIYPFIVKIVPFKRLIPDIFDPETGD